jgi:2-oxoisovalerate dehydrogenase E1 component
VSSGSKDFNWSDIVYKALVSRGLDHTEETKLVPEKKVLYQFTARGHDVPQIMLGGLLTHQHDAVGAYYRSRPMLLSLGLSIDDAFAGPMGKSGGFSDGRDIGVVCNFPRRAGKGPVVMPMSGDVGSQYTPIAGWAQSILYHQNVLKDASYKGAIGVVLGGDASVATSGFWSALTMATTLKLPMLFYIEDNGYGISVPSSFQTPGGDISKNLASFSGLTILSGNGSDIAEAAKLMQQAVTHVRSHGKGPLLLRLTVPRLSGHSGQDTQTYKPKEFIENEKARDPLVALQSFLVPATISAAQWEGIEAKARADVQLGLEKALARPEPDTATVRRYLYSENGANGQVDVQQTGGLLSFGYQPPDCTDQPEPEPTRINLVTAVRRTLESELKINPRVVVFGEDVGPKGGVHAATLGLHETFGADRVFDTSLSEEGIIGRAVGMAIAGLMPVAEIQFRKYADPAQEQLNNCGTMRWRTANRFAAPIVVRMPGGFSKCGDPWHSVSGEVLWAHTPGWQVCYPSNAEDAVGLLRAALRSNNPTIFFEHRHMLDAMWARRPYPGDAFVLPLGKAKCLREGSAVTVVTWGAMVERCEQAIESAGVSAELLDLRCIMPWDKEAVLTSVRKTRKVLIVHEDGMTAGFGAEIAAIIAEEAFFSLDAPVSRMAVPDVPIPYNVPLMESVLPSVSGIAEKIAELATE